MNHIDRGFLDELAYDTLETRREALVEHLSHCEDCKATLAGFYTEQASLKQFLRTDVERGVDPEELGDGFSTIPPKPRVRPSRILMAAALALFGLVGLLTIREQPESGDRRLIPGKGQDPGKPKDNAASPQSPEASRARATQDLKHDFPGFPFLFHDGMRPYLIALEPSEGFKGEDLIGEYARRMETVRLAFGREVGDPLGLPVLTEPLVVVILNSRSSFDRYCERSDKKRMAPSIKGLYQYADRRLLTYHDDNVGPEVLLHEGIHQLIHCYSLRDLKAPQARSSYWWTEGFAQYFECFRRLGVGEIEFSEEAYHQRVSSLGKRDGAFIPLTGLLGLTVEGFWDCFQRGQQEEPAEGSRKAQLYYAESLALVHFLLQSGPDHRKVWDEYFRLELRGEGGLGPFEMLVRKNLGIDLGEFETRFFKAMAISAFSADKAANDILQKVDASILVGRITKLDADGVEVLVTGEKEPRRVLLRDLMPYSLYKIQLDRVDKTSGEARLALGEFCMARGLYSQAEKEFDEAARLDQSLEEKAKRRRGEARQEFARTLFNQAKSSAAEKKYEYANKTCQVLVEKYSDTPYCDEAKKLIAKIAQDITQEFEAKKKRLEDKRDGKDK